MKYQKLFYILMFSPLVVSVIALCFLPDFYRLIIILKILSIDGEANMNY